MLIVCPACATEYTLDPGRVGSKGRIVRCARCKTSWFAAAPAPEGATSPTVIEEADTVQVGRRRTGRIAAKRPAAKKRFRVTTGLATATVLVTAVVVLSAVAFRVPLVRAAPGSAALFAAAGLPVNVVGLAIEEVSSAFDEENGRRVLVTEGTIANPTQHEQAVPDLDVTMLGADEDTLYQWSAKPPAGELAAGERKRFSIRLASPPPAGAHAVVTFVAPVRGPAVASR